SMTDLVGVWQSKTPVISSTLQANFQFYANGKFVYNVSGYADLNPLYNVSGSYKLADSIIGLKIEQYKVLSGFKVQAADHGFEFGSFDLDSGKVVTVMQNNSTYDEHTFSVVRSSKIKFKNCIEIDSDKYYKISNNPAQYNH